MSALEDLASVPDRCPFYAPPIPLWGLVSWDSATGAARGALVIADGATARRGWMAAGISLTALLAVLASGNSTSGRG